MTLRRAVTAGTALGAVALHAAPVLAAPPPPQEVDRTIRTVLQRPEFEGLRETWLERIRERALAFIVDQLGSLFGESATSLVAWGLLVVAVLLLVAVVVRIVRRRVAVEAPAGSAVDVVVRRSPAAWLEDAREARRRGDRREAVRLGYRAVVAALDARGLVDDSDGRTVGDHRATLAATGATRGAFDEAADVFERSWYGRRPVDDHEVDRVEDAARRVGAGDA